MQAHRFKIFAGFWLAAVCADEPTTLIEPEHTEFDESITDCTDIALDGPYVTVESEDPVDFSDYSMYGGVEINDGTYVLTEAVAQDGGGGVPAGAGSWLKRSTLVLRGDLLQLVDETTRLQEAMGNPPTVAWGQPTILRFAGRFFTTVVENNEYGFSGNVIVAGPFCRWDTMDGLTRRGSESLIFNYNATESKLTLTQSNGNQGGPQEIVLMTFTRSDLVADAGAQALPDTYCLGFNSVGDRCGACLCDACKDIISECPTSGCEQALTCSIQTSCNPEQFTNNSCYDGAMQSLLQSRHRLTRIQRRRLPAVPRV